jgi:hypothetical protein
MTTDLDHLAVGTPVLADGWELFGGVLGDSWAYGGDRDAVSRPRRSGRGVRQIGRG